MGTVALMIIAFLGYLIAYHTYGRFLARKIFQLRKDAQTPSRVHQDGIDFVPTRKGIIFGHHYTSIAGTGPIVGPAIGVIWGWLPALIWVFFGSIVMGAVHDFGAVVISMRNEGRSISECAAKYIGPRVRYIFFLIIFLLLVIIIAIFGVVIAAIFDMFPQSVFPVWMEIPIAVALGWAIYNRKWNVTIGTALAVTLMYVTVVLGHFIPLEMPDLIAGSEASGSESANVIMPATGLWVIILLLYAFAASSLPVTTLLQPRDYINAWQLFIAMGLIVLGILGTAASGKLELAAPALNTAAAGAPPLVPFLFITIACGAISGFHALVASGTTSKQVANETDAQFVGYGSMMMEAVLATLVIIAVAAGIGLAYTTADGTVLKGIAAWDHHYSSWVASQGLGSKITAVVVGSANMIEAFHIPRHLGIIIMGVFIASFAGTTLDSATRIQRYVITELTSHARMPFATNRYMATALAVLTAAALAFATGADGKGALTLWPMFGAGNQLLAALGLLVLSNYLRTKGGYKYLVSAIPCLFMLTITIWAALVNERNFIAGALDASTAGGASLWLLAVINGAVILLAGWMIVEGVVSLVRLGNTPQLEGATG
ncbi:MAG: carbon starvation protein A [Candidatus Latescibacteria bacterium]|nr:carbon starvation protein A [Candidatus Latescibacterota bacterium]NIM22609.1 carbon starvation protein A [Candidatus Latescibacterota bacterium]NIM64898.1 carbon starvation protein A [Candidatus Latescibacterota bacterium]NIO01413.1 carbon starvation protein A [Candidatus Latescibacterota bacterium]NIO27923.1 carbon starvation protein A [Candidatus Latescibacterota bacterium]